MLLEDKNRFLGNCVGPQQASRDVVSTFLTSKQRVVPTSKRRCVLTGSLCSCLLISFCPNFSFCSIHLYDIHIPPAYPCIARPPSIIPIKMILSFIVNVFFLIVVFCLSLLCLAITYHLLNS